MGVGAEGWRARNRNVTYIRTVLVLNIFFDRRSSKIELARFRRPWLLGPDGRVTSARRRGR